MMHAMQREGNLMLKNNDLLTKFNISVLEEIIAGEPQKT